jgi:hypothetical protein
MKFFSFTSVGRVLLLLTVVLALDCSSGSSSSCWDEYERKKNQCNDGMSNADFQRCVKDAAEQGEKCDGSR